MLPNAVPHACRAAEKEWLRLGAVPRLSSHSLLPSVCHRPNVSRGGRQARYVALLVSQTQPALLPPPFFRRDVNIQPKRPPLPSARPVDSCDSNSECNCVCYDGTADTCLPCGDVYSVNSQPPACLDCYACGESCACSDCTPTPVDDCLRHCCGGDLCNGCCEACIPNEAFCNAAPCASNCEWCDKCCDNCCESCCPSSGGGDSSDTDGGSSGGGCLCDCGGCDCDCGGCDCDCSC